MNKSSWLFLTGLLSLSFLACAQDINPSQSSSVQSSPSSSLSSSAQNEEGVQELPVNSESSQSPLLNPPEDLNPDSINTPSVNWSTQLRKFSTKNAQFFSEINKADENALNLPLGFKIQNLPSLKKGSHGKNVQVLISALSQRGFLKINYQPTEELSEKNSTENNSKNTNVISDNIPDKFDDSVKEAVKLAQNYYGLVSDGIAGSQLYLNLALTNIDRQQALNDLALQIDKDAQIARQEGAHHMVIVNIPSFTLHVIDLQTGLTSLESRVIIGQPTRQTPIFRTNIINLKYNPDWTPPPSLVKIGRHYVPPGIDNPLGLIRFSTNNHLNVYLHDTDEHGIFKRSVRDRSAGCIRVQEFKELAETLSGESLEEVNAEIAIGKIHYKKIKEVPVFTIYSLIGTQTAQSETLNSTTPSTYQKAAIYPDIYHLIDKDKAIGESSLKDYYN